MSVIKSEAPKTQTKVKRLQLEIRFKGVQPNIIAFYAIRSAVMTHFWDVDIHGRESDDFGAFDVFINDECMFTRKEAHSYPNLGQLLREISVALSGDKKEKTPHPTSASKSKTVTDSNARDSEWKSMDLSKLDVKTWLVNGKGLL